MFFRFFFMHQAYADTVSKGGMQSEFHLKGVLISDSWRSALVNDTVLLEGDRIGGAEILAIRPAEVEIRMGSQHLTVPVGSRADWTQAARREQSMPAIAAAEPNPAASYGPVKQGETLSEITESLLPSGVTMNQVMVALHDANPLAFNGNMNILLAGVVLRLPDKATLLRHSHESATAEISYQMAELRHDEPQPARLPDRIVVAMQKSE